MEGKLEIHICALLEILSLDLGYIKKRFLNGPPVKEYLEITQKICKFNIPFIEFFFLQAYQIVNEEFAKLTIKAIEKCYEQHPNSTPLVWIHDYHLMYAANFIRTACDELGYKIKMAFFLHIPFPSWDIVRLFPWADVLLQGVLGCDSIGFHLEGYCLNFIDCCQRELGCRVDRQRMLVEHNNRTVSVHALPISIPYDRFVKMALDAPIILNNKTDEQMLLGVDRLDYTKGLVHRLRAFERLLEKHPQHLEKVRLLQIAVPSRTDVKEYKELKEELDKLIGKINGKFSTPNWSPIRYIYGSITHDQLAAFYRDASVALVTPLRDGMNLVAKEFVACQTREPGVLILSPFAGAGSTMQEALLVNPYEENQFAEVMHRALTMPEDERELRMKHLRRREKQRDVNFWLRQVLKSVDTLKDDKSNVLGLEPVSEDEISSYLSSYVTDSTRLALILDYDGTLAPIAPHPDIAHLPGETKVILEKLSKMPDVNIAIISGRSLDNVREMVGIDGITYAGNNGFEILHPDGTLFLHPVPPCYEENLKNLKKSLEAVCIDGAFVEDKGPCVSWHYRKVNPPLRKNLVAKAGAIFSESGISVKNAHMSLEARPPVTWDTGRAAIYILRTLFGVDWSDRISTIFAGDDDTDEDAMAVLSGMAITFRVTDSQIVRSRANYRLQNTDAVFTMLKWIERRLESRAPKSDHRHRSRTASASSGPRSRAHSFTDGKSVGEICESPSAMVTNLVLNETDYRRIVRKASDSSRLS